LDEMHISVGRRVLPRPLVAFINDVSQALDVLLSVVFYS